MTGTYTLPRVILEFQGIRMGDQAIGALGEVRVQQRFSLPTLCELAFYSPPGPLDAVASLTPGMSLRMLVEGSDIPLFTGEILALEYVHGPSGDLELRVRAYDLLHRLRKQHETRVHVQVALSSLAQEMVAPLGLAVSASTDSPTWQTLIQHGQSNLEFLSERCEQCGAYFTLRDSVLHLLTLEGSGDHLPLVLGNSLLEARIEVNGEAAVDSFSVTGWNPLEVKEYTGRASAGRGGRQVSTRVASADVGGQPEWNLVGTVVEDTRQAELLAQAELDRHLAREVVLWGVAEGDPRLRPGALVQVQGVAPPVEGQYVLTSVTHTIDGKHGFLSEISTMPPPPLESRGELTATFGEVTQVDDPEDLGRVRSSLPAFGDLQTDWLQVLAVGGGSGKGLLMLPDVGDKVLVLCSRGDPSRGVVVGGLFGMAGSPDSGVEGGSVRRYTLRTSGGQLIQVDDGKKVLRLENSDGSYFDLSPETVKVHAACNLEIEAPGCAIVIRGDSIDFERG